MLLLAAVALAAWLIPQEQDASGSREGHALDGGIVSQSEVGSHSMQVGKDYWLSLPQPTNLTGEPVTILNARFVSLPKGLN